MMLTPTNIALRKAFPWAASVQKILRNVQPDRFLGNHLMFGSDYGGQHKNSKYRAYCFLVSDHQTAGWSSARNAVRRKYMSDGRRMSFKCLNDPHRQRALVPFLQAADALNGRLICFLIDKSVPRLSTGKNSFEKFGRSLGLKARWNEGAFEDMARKAHLFSLCVAQWSRPYSHITWITDQDDFVANEDRLDDAQRFAARLLYLYYPHQLGIFAMNSTAIDEEDRLFEDYVAIPDLAAGALSDLCSHLSIGEGWHNASFHALDEGSAKEKSELISDWIWFPYAHLRRTCIVIEMVKGMVRVMRLEQVS